MNEKRRHRKHHNFHRSVLGILMSERKGLNQMSLKQIQERLGNRTSGRQKVTGATTPAQPAAPIVSPGRQKAKPYVGNTAMTTQVKLSQRAKEVIAKAETTAEVQAVLDSELPKGYTAIGKNDLPKLMALKAAIIKNGIAGFDYETNGDTEDDYQDPQDHELVGVSFSYQIGQAFYMPLQHVGYGANWDIAWFVENFLKPVLEHPNVLVIAHNVAFEHQISLLYGIDMYPKVLKRKVVDTMIMVKSLGLPETVNGLGEVVVGLKPSTKALLSDKETGLVHGILHVDDIKTFDQMVTVMVQVGVLKSGKNKGQPKYEKKKITFGERPVDQETVDYGCSDSDWALGLYYKLMPLMEAEDLLDVFFELNMPFVMVLGEYELTGWRVNQDRLRDMERIARMALDGYKDEKTGEEVIGLDDELYDALYELTVEQGLAETDDEGNIIVPAGSYPMGQWRRQNVFLTIKNSAVFNWNSTNHKQWLFFHILKIDLRGLERSKSTGLPSTGKDNMEKIIEDYEGDSAFMKVMRERGKYVKLLSTYVEGMLPFAREDTSKIHTNLKLVQTWRLASSKPNLQNCFDKKTRILTRRGWQFFYDLTDSDEVAQYHEDSGKITFVKPLQFIARKEKELVHIHKQHIDLMVTKQHRCLLRNRRNNEWLVTPAEDYRLDAHQYHAGRYHFGSQPPKHVTREFIDLLCMTQADGYYHDGGIAFSWVKERKIQRFLDIVKALGIPFSEQKPYKGRRSFRLLKSRWIDDIRHYLGDDKVFGSWLLQIGRDNAHQFLESVYFWDGCFTRDNHYSSNQRTNAEWVQIMHVLTGERANVREYQGTRNINYQVDRTKRPYSGTANIQRDIVEYNDTVYCVEVPSSFIMVERNGKVMITGNCPRADNDPMGIRGVFEAPVYDLRKDYSKQNIFTRPPEIMYKENLSGATMYIACD